MLNFLIDLGLLAYSCRINEYELTELVFDNSIRGVTGSSCNIGNNYSFLACNFVYE